MSEPMKKYLTKDNKIMFDCLSNVADSLRIIATFIWLQIANKAKEWFREITHTAVRRNSSVIQRLFITYLEVKSI